MADFAAALQNYRIKSSGGGGGGLDNDDWFQPPRHAPPEELKKTLTAFASAFEATLLSGEQSPQQVKQFFEQFEADVRTALTRCRNLIQGDGLPEA